MKIIAFIMAFLVLALSVMPCADKDNAVSVSKTEVVKTLNHQNEPQQDHCSPFCQCACCAGFSINHFIASVTVIPPTIRKTQPAYLPKDIIEISLPIWQPPQLV